MNSWGNDQFSNHMMAMMTMMPPGQIPTGGLGTGGGQAPMMALAPQNMLLPEVNSVQPSQNMLLPEVNSVQPSQIFIGPIIPENETVDGSSMTSDQPGSESVQDKRGSKDSSSRRDRDRDRDHCYRRSRSPYRHRRDKTQGRDRNGRGDRPSKWSQEKADLTSLIVQQSPSLVPNNMMIAGQMMQYGNVMPNAMANPMMNQMPNMDVNNMTNMSSMPVMSGNMPNMMLGMNAMPNVMIMNHQMPQFLPIYLQIGVILPPAPGHSIPARRECPPGCRTIFIGGLPSTVTDDVITDVFQRFGMICEVNMHRQGVCHVRYEREESVEHAFSISGCRFKLHEQMESEATTLYVDYALNRDDQTEFERNKHKRNTTPPRAEPFTPSALTSLTEKIKNDDDFAEVALTLTAWLERGDCTKKNANTFYSLIQASNNQLRRLFNEKMAVDEEYQNMKSTMKEKFAHILMQFEQVAKILTAAKHQRASDHFSKQQRRNIEMWLKMTEELENMKEEFNANFEEDENEKVGRNVVSSEKYEQLKMENENLMCELDGYKNEAHLAKDEAERKFETFKAHFIAQQALQNNKGQVYPTLPPPPMPFMDSSMLSEKPKPPPPLPGEKYALSASVSISEAKLISLLTAFLMVHPLGASLDYLVAYVRSLVPNVTQSNIHDVLTKYSDVFRSKITGVGACIEQKWGFVTFDTIKME